MIDVTEKAKKSAQNIKDLSELAKQFIAELNGEQEQFQVEEVLQSDKKNWIVTVSYFRKHKKPNELQKTLGLLGNRVYKRLTIERDGYNVVGMSDWSPERRETA